MTAAMADQRQKFWEITFCSDLDLQAMVQTSHGKGKTQKRTAG
jgi:hypothetical protein